MKRTEAVEWSKFLKPVNNCQTNYGNAAAVRDVPAEFSSVESIAPEEIVELATVLRSNFNRFARNARKRSTKTKRLPIKMSKVTSRFMRS